MRSSLIVASLFILMFAFGCGKQDAGPVVIPTSAGRGDSGRAILSVIPRHNGMNVDTATVYIKYNALNAPVNGYDDSMVCTLNAGNPLAKFDSLRNGNYYLYCTGHIIDTTGGLNKYVPLSGGTGYTVITQSTTPVTILLPVNQ
ncbi:MAG: hypothetical protein WCG87_04580 [Bacteroidota bacterium]